jgi:DNA damage-inducible protein 1
MPLWKRLSVRLLVSEEFSPFHVRDTKACIAFQNVHTRLYVQVEVNGKSVPAVVRTGAQVTLMSAEYASQCNITRLIDRRYNGTIEGVGAETLIGRVHSVQIKVGNIFRACSLTIIAGNHIGLHLGLDILQRYQASIDLRRNVLVIQNQAIRFLSEDEIPKGFEDE